MPQLAPVNHLVAATAGPRPNVNVLSGRRALTGEIELISGLSTEFVILWNQLLKRALRNHERLLKFYSRFSSLLQVAVPHLDLLVGNYLCFVLEFTLFKCWEA